MSAILDALSIVPNDFIRIRALLELAVENLVSEYFLGNTNIVRAPAATNLLLLHNALSDSDLYRPRNQPLSEEDHFRSDNLATFSKWVAVDAVDAIRFDVTNSDPVRIKPSDKLSYVSPDTTADPAAPYIQHFMLHYNA